MTAIYVANWCRMGSFLAATEDRGHVLDGGLEEMASPQLEAARLDRGFRPEEWIDDLKGQVEEEYREVWADDGELVPMEFYWETEGWQTPAKGREYIQLYMTDASSWSDEDPLALLVVQRVELEGRRRF